MFEKAREIAEMRRVMLEKAKMRRKMKCVEKKLNVDAFDICQKNLIYLHFSSYRLIHYNFKIQSLSLAISKQ